MKLGLKLVILFLIITVKIGFGQVKTTVDSSIVNQINFANSQYEIGNADTAIHTLENLLPYLEQTNQNKLLIEVLSNLSFQYSGLSFQQFEIIESYALKAINLADSLQIESVLLDKSYYSLLKLYNSNHFEKVIEIAPEALSKMTDKTLIPSVNTYFLESLIVLREFDKAKTQIEIYEKSITTEKDKIHAFYLKADIETALRNYELAMQYLNQAIDISKKHADTDKNILVKIYDLLARNYSYISKNDLAIASMEKALQIHLSMKGVTCETSSIYGNIAYNYLEKGIQKRQQEDFDSTIKWYQKAIDNTRIYCDNDASLSTYFHMMAYTYYSMKDFGSVHAILDSSMYYAQLYELEDIAIENYTISALANTQLNNYEGALNDMNYLLSKRIPTFKPTDYKDNPTFFHTDKYFLIGQYIAYKAEAFIKKWGRERDTSDLYHAIQTYELAFQFFEERKKDLMRFEVSKRRYRNHLSGVSNFYLKALYYQYEQKATAANLSEIHIELEKRKALSLIENIPLISDVLPDSVIQQEQTFRNEAYKLEQKIINLNFTKDTDSLIFHRQALINNKTDYNSFLDKLEKKYSSYIKYGFRDEISQVENIQKLLKADEIVLNYAILNSHLLIYIITNDTVKVTYNKIDQINDLIEDLKLLTDSPLLVQDKKRLKFISTSNQLYDKLIRPIAKDIDSKKRLFVIPEKNLFYVPFELLLSSNEDLPFEQLDFLIKKFEISYLYASSSLERLHKQVAINDKSLLAFAPVFENGIDIKIATRTLNDFTDSLYRSIDNNLLVALPNSEIEVISIAEIIKENSGQATLLVKKEATKTALLNKLNNEYQFLHIATHGLINFKEPKLSALACFQNENIDETLLFVNEIQMQPIQADLVVLSSCESGIGQIAFGEGLLALNRSFIYAGANNVMFSLWKVNDEYTSQLMISFYKTYFETQSYTVALRQAKLKMLQNPITANPRYWAAFVLIGK